MERLLPIVCVRSDIFKVLCTLNNAWDAEAIGEQGSWMRRAQLGEDVAGGGFNNQCELSWGQEKKNTVVVVLASAARLKLFPEPGSLWIWRPSGETRLAAVPASRPTNYKCNTFVSRAPAGYT